MILLVLSIIIHVYLCKDLGVAMAMASYEGFYRTFDDDDDCGVTEAAMPLVQLSFFDFDHFRINWRVGQMLGNF